MREVYEYLQKCQTFYVATIDGDQARVRPFGAVSVYEDKLYIQTGKVKNVYKQMKANPKIEICAMSSDGTWIRIAATAVEDDRVGPKQQALDENPSLKSMYAVDDGNHIVFYLKDATATISSFAGEPKVIQF